MRSCERIAWLTLLLILTVGLVGTEASARVRHGTTEVLIEGGAAQPMGDLKADYSTAAGFQATTGFEIGFRLRQLWPSGWAIAPTFHYAQFGSYLGDHQSLGAFETTTSLYRYGTDIQYFFPSRRQQPRFYLTGGAALVRNRLREDYLDDDSFFQSEGVNSIELSGGIGLQVGNFEFTARYHRNRFTTTRFWEDVESYDWDAVSMRIALGLPTAH